MSTSDDAGIVYGPEYVCPECLDTICQNSIDLENWEVQTPCWTCRIKIAKKKVIKNDEKET